jgi:uncharacterized membrane protein
MVQTNFDLTSRNGSIILTPNNSATWNFNMWIWSSLALLSGGIAAGFLWQGLWLILPFSGLEILALYTGLYLCVRANFTIEVITFKDDLVTIERGHKAVEKTWEYQRSWAKIFVHIPEIRGYPKKIFIRSHGKQLELGAFLNKKDKEVLIRNLKHIVYC